MKILITGQSGFIGNHLIKFICKNYHLEIINIDDLLRERKFPKETALLRCEGVKTILHLAYDMDFQNASSETNYINGNIDLLRKCLELNEILGSNFIFLSSYVYGHPVYLPTDESHPTKPANLYTKSKLICESYCHEFTKNLNCTIIRPFNIYGEGQKDHFLIPKILGHLGKDYPLVLFNKKSKRDFLHVDDFIKGLMKVVTSFPKGYNVYNLGSGVSTSVENLIYIVKKYYPLDVVFKEQTLRNDVAQTLCDNSKFVKAFNWKPQISIEKGILDLLDKC